MSEKKGGKSESSEASSIAAVDRPLEEILQRLPTQQREQLQKQYELPEVKVGIITILRYATPLEMALQILGLIMAIVQGTSAFLCRFGHGLIVGAALPLMTILLGSLTNLFGGFVSPGAPSLTPPASEAEFNSEAYSLEAMINCAGLSSCPGLVLYRHWSPCFHLYRDNMLDFHRGTYQSANTR